LEFLEKTRGQNGGAIQNREAILRHQAITKLSAYPLDVGLKAPFVIASARLDRVQNVAIRVDLADGSHGWGEIPTLHPVTPENQAGAFAAAQRIGDSLVGRDLSAWRSILDDLSATGSDSPTVRAGLEMALFDALARSWRVPLYRLFGGAQAHVETDITIPICSREKARDLAAHYRAQGFSIIKTKVGLDVGDDVQRLTAIREGHPRCQLVLDANEGYSLHETLDVLRALRRLDLEPALLEQPVPRDDWEAQAKLVREAGVPVAADESCRSTSDALRIAQHHLAHVINIKMAKSGVAQALDIVAIARAAGLGLMIGGMIETRLAMGFSAHFAAGTGCFQWIDLDTPLLLSRDPVRGGYTADGPRYDLSRVTAGHGAEPDTETTPREPAWDGPTSGPTLTEL